MLGVFGKNALTIALRVCAVAFAACLFATGQPGDARAEVQVGAYGGWSESFDSDVDIRQPGGTNLSIDDVDWEGDSFTFDGGPPFYGVKLIYWKDSHPNWGIMLDYQHAKVNPKLGQLVNVNGTRDGAAVAGLQPLNQTVSMLEFTDGLNILTLNLMYRQPRGGWTPFGGIGVGLSIPNVEFNRAPGAAQSGYTNEYQITGIAVQGILGAEKDITDRISAFGEYRLSYTDNDADLGGGGSLETEIWTSSLIFGLSYRFNSAPAPASYK